MDRQLLLALGVSLFLLGGCSKSQSPPASAATTARPASAAPEEQPQPTETHRPVTVDPAAEAARRAAELARIAQEEKAFAEMARRKTEYEFAPTLVEGALEKPPSGDLPQPMPATPPAEQH